MSDSATGSGPGSGSAHPLFVATLRLLALASSANGLWMLLHAWSWFSLIPGVANTGEANAHLIHDVGVAYLVCGIGLFWCARDPRRAHAVFVGVTLFFVGHAIGHMIEILFGLLPHSHWLIDLPLVFGPAILLAWLAMPARWRRLSGG